MNQLSNKSGPISATLHDQNIQMNATNNLNWNDVICGRGRHCFSHPGNLKFREVVEKFLPLYERASCKVQKSNVVSNIVDFVRRNSPNGGFVKLDEGSGHWEEVGDRLAREKVGQALRDALHTLYRSSTTSKKNRRKDEQAERNESMARKIDKNLVVVTVMAQLARQVSNELPDHYVGAMFDAANVVILQELKRIEAFK